MAERKVSSEGVGEELYLTTYELQVLLGTTTHGCNMVPDRVFSLPMAWHRLHALGLIDRTDGLAIATDKGDAVVNSALRSSVNTEDTDEDAFAALAEEELLSAIEVPSEGEAVRDPWVDTRLVRFDDTVQFGHGGFDFDRWESLRQEMHTRHGSFAVWKSGKHSWSLYGGKYGVMALDRYSCEDHAKADVEQYVLSLDNEAPAAASKVTDAMVDAAHEAIEQSYRTESWEFGPPSSLARSILTAALKGDRS